MLSPSSKGWIKKYFSLEKEGEITFAIKDRIQQQSAEKIIRNIGVYTGLTYGNCIRMLYPKKIDTSLWTDIEVQKIAFFESLLEVYRTVNPYFFDLDDFVKKLLEFYGPDNVRNASFLGMKWTKNLDEQEIQLEHIINQRLNFLQQRFDFTWWKYSLSNTFVYLEVLLFYYFFKGDNDSIQNLTVYEEGALSVMSGVCKYDGNISSPDKTILNIYIASSRLDKDVRKDFVRVLFDVNQKANSNAFTAYPINIRLLYLDLMVLIANSSHQEEQECRSYILEQALILGLSEEAVESAESNIQSYLIDAENKIGVFSNKNSYEKMFDSFGNRWRKILLRNKDKIVVELAESKDLIALVSKSTTQELTPEEKIRVKVQFRDIIRSVPALGIFMLPGGAILLPLILKIIPDLIPSAFRDNEVSDED